MKSWIDNFLQYENNKNPGKCPCCGSSNVDVEELFWGRRSVTFKCKQCGKGDHFDGIYEKSQEFKLADRAEMVYRSTKAVGE